MTETYCIWCETKGPRYRRNCVHCHGTGKVWIDNPTPSWRLRAREAQRLARAARAALRAANGGR